MVYSNDPSRGRTPLVDFPLDEPGLSITSVRTWRMVGRAEPAWEIATATYAHTYATFVEVELANGAVGWGECLVRQAPSAAKAVIDEVFAPMLIGQSAGRVQALWDDMYHLFRTRGHSRGVVLEAIAGVDIALWDALGRSTGRPVCDLLWGVGREAIDCYASSIMVIDRPATLEQAEYLISEGHTAIKMKIGRDLRSDVDRVHAVRALIGDDVQLMVDINCNWDVPAVVQFIRATRSAELTWIEEPLMPDDLVGYRKIAAAFPEVPLAAGEAEFTASGFRDFLENRILSYFQPDVARAGGITGMLRIASLADAFGIPIAPHVGASGGVCAAAAIQVSAAIPNFRIYEHMYLPHELQDVFVQPPPAAAHGRVTVPRGPGLGLEIDRGKVDRLKG